jgi:hypothetical protein
MLYGMARPDTPRYRKRDHATSICRKRHCVALPSVFAGPCEVEPHSRHGPPDQAKSTNDLDNPPFGLVRKYLLTRSDQALPDGILGLGP